MIFPVLKIENIVQVDDQTRIDVRKSYISPDEAAITLIEIEPEASAGYIDVTDSQYLDWQYSSEGDKVVTLRVTTDGLPTNATATITIKTATEENLFSSDNDLVDYEDDILSYVREGRNSFLDKHRTAQKVILDELDANKYWKEDFARYTAVDIVDIQEFKQWSIFLTLKIIFRSLSNAVDDLFDQRANKYSGRAVSAKKRATFRLDFDDSGTIEEESEIFNNQVTRMVRG